MDDLGCEGTEGMLSDCWFGGWGIHDCDASENVGVVCSGSSNVEGQVMLYPGPASGRLEIFHAGQWGTVCDDYFGAVDAKVVCKQLGLPNGAATALFLTAVPTAGSAELIWMDDVVCSGAEGSLAQCPFASWGFNDCDYTENVGVSCA